MVKVVLIRTVSDDKCTLGYLYVYNRGKQVYSCASLELPWRDNAIGVSRVPDGTYKLVLEYSPHFKKDLWEFKGVPGRSEVKIHAGNFVSQLNGCVLVGTDHLDIDKDGIPDVINSRRALDGFHKAMYPAIESEIIVKWF